MLRSFDGRAEKEVVWRKRHMAALKTIGRFAGIDPCVVASWLSKRIEGGRRPVFIGGYHVGYASRGAGYPLNIDLHS